jgi:DNA invertase Pin-like site-specific DNA recombinase/ribosome-associated translation inhibitor RaiA
MKMPEVILIPATIKNQQDTSTKTRQLRVAAYCRVSTDEEEQISSFENQIAYFTDRIQSNPDWTMAGLYADEGLSGLIARKRPQFLRMIRDCKKGRIDLILTKKLSRFSRNTLDTLKYTRLLKSLGIPVIFEEDHIDTSKAQSEMVITFMGAFAQAESESISANVKWGKRQAFKEGKVTYNYAHLYGYEKGADGKPKIVKSEAETVRRIFNEFLAGYSIGRIKQGLENDGIPTKKGGAEWSQAVISRILTNEKMYGDVLNQKTFVSDTLTKKTKKNNGELPQYLVKNAHAGIITYETFQKAQAEFARHNSRKKISDKTSTELSKYSSLYALTDILICGNCGTPYRRVTWSKNGKKKIVWRCVNRIDYGTKYCKESPTIEEILLQQAVLYEINQLIVNRDVTETVMANLKTVISGNTDSKDAYAAECRIKTLETEMMTLVQTHAKTPLADFDRQISEIGNEINRLKEKIKQYETNMKKSAETADRVNKIQTALTLAPDAITEWDETVIRHFIHTIKVLSKDKIRIIFNGGLEIETYLSPAENRETPVKSA